MSTTERHQPSETPFPTSGRLAAVDFGTVRIGVAICDPGWQLSSPLEVIPNGGDEVNSDRFRKLITEHQVKGLVVGLPIHCDGGESRKSRECREFAEWLAETTSVPVRLFDERFTTAQANQRLRFGKLTRQKKKRRLDAVAAQVLLESFLEASRYDGRVAGQPLTANAGGDRPLDDSSD